MADPFDIADPYAGLLDDPYGSDPYEAEQRRRRRRLRFSAPPQRAPQLPPEREDSLMRELLDAGIGGVELAGNVLDTPGSFVRGLLAGDPGRAFGGILDPSQRVSGRDLLEQYGALGKNKPGLDWGDVGGFAAEVLADPLTYTGVGLLTKGGQAASKTGKLSRGLVNQIKAGERSLVSFGLPFTQGAEFTGDAAAKTAQAIGRTARRPVDASDTLLGFAGADKPISRGLDYGGRVARAVFDPAVAGHVDPRTQELASEIASKRYGTESRYTAAARGGSKVIDVAANDFATVMPQLPPQFQGVGHRSLFERTARLAAEADPDPAIGASRAVDDLFGPGHDQLKPLFQRTVEQLRPELDNPINRLQQLGGKADKLAAYFPRTGVEFGRATAGARRRGAYRHVPADILERMAADPKTRGRGANPAAHIEATYGQWLDPNYGAKYQNGQLVAQGGGIAGHAKALAKKLNEHAVGEPMFEPGVVKDYAGRVKGLNVKVSQLEAAQDFLQRYATDAAQAAARYPNAKLVTLPMAYKRSKVFASDRALKYFATQRGLQQGQVRKLVVPKDVADAVREALRPLDRQSSWGQAVGGFIDSVNSFTKRWQTLPFPKHHALNLSGGQYLNVATGLMRSTSDLKGYAKTVGEVAAGQIDPRYAEEMRLMRVLGGDVTEGLSPESALQMGQAGFGHTASHDVPIGNQPVTSKLQYLNPAKAGEVVAKKVETLNRAPLYVWLRNKGYTPEAAAREVALRQFDYSNLTPADRILLRRVFPFWSWMKHSSAITAKTLAQHPGGVMAQSIRAGETGRKESGFLPDWLGETAAIPWPGDPDRFITRIGLPQDDALSKIAFGATPLQSGQRMVEKMISQTNPLISTAYSVASEREPFFGRELRELYPYPTDDLLTNVALSKLPTGRPVSTYRTLTDERKSPAIKALNFLAPANVTDLSGGIEKQRQFAVTNALEDLLDESGPEGVRRFESYYVPRDNRDELDPEVADLMTLLRSLNDRARRAAKEK